jgi:hypothetical protein
MPRGFLAVQHTIHGSVAVTAHTGNDEDHEVSGIANGNLGIDNLAD